MRYEVVSAEVEAAFTWIERPDKAALVAEAARPDRQVHYYAEVADEWRVSPGRSEGFEQWGPGPTRYRIPDRSMS